MARKRQLSSLEEKQIRQKIDYVLTDKNYDLLKNASTVSFIAALVPLFAFYQSVAKSWLFSWLAGMYVIHLGCIALVTYYQRYANDINNITPWKNLCRVGVFFSTLMWGSMGVMLVPESALAQNFLLFLLLTISSSIAFGTSVDYPSSCIGVISCLCFYIARQFYQGIILDSRMSIYAGSLLVLYAGFLLIVCVTSYRLMKKSVELSFRNMALADKLTDVNSQLKDLNNELEDRVALRTKELYSALGTVTYQATHDLVTSLPNQTWILRYISELIIKKPNEPFAVICLSINSMENITDRYGYYSNDIVIKEVSARLVNTLEKGHEFAYKVAIARRDVFVILVENIDHHDINKFINPIFIAFHKPVEISKNKTAEAEQLFCSIGYSLYPKDALIADQLLIKADSAMFYTKKQYENNFEHHYESYNKEVTETIQYKVQLRKDIQSAIEKDEFYLCYQPIVDIKTGLIKCTEALLRWVHPVTGETISPVEIIKVAENYNLIIPLGEWVLHKACAQNYLWNQLGFTNIVSVNLSARQFERGNLIHSLTRILKETRLNPALLDLELTETEAFRDHTLSIIHQLRELGVSLSIDDYGKGFSNLSKLKKINFNKIKIDMEFIQTLPDDVNSQIIVTSSIKMAKALGIKIVAEGVETQEQYEFLAKHGCDLVQGYLLYKPLTAEKITELMITQKNYSSNDQQK